MIVCPGNLVSNGKTSSNRRFQLPFEILTTISSKVARSGNWFLENSLAICRLDKLSRNEDVQAKLHQTDWDLIVCDEAHKMSATFFGNEVSYTKRYRLGQLLSDHHPQLSPDDGHSAQRQGSRLQLFLALLDGDRLKASSATACISPTHPT